MKLLLALLLILAQPFQTTACLNGETKVLAGGVFLYEDMESSVPTGHTFVEKDAMIDGVKHLDSLYRATKNLDYLSDKGLLLILLRRYDEAIALYQEIERIEPGRYSTASNIGTAYELNGRNEEALHWIRKSVEIDPKSHHGSEWIHVKILEAKIKGEEYISSHFLLNTDFGYEDMPTTLLPRKELDSLANALYFQLTERMSFINQQDKIVAQLLFDYGNIELLRKNVETAKGTYKMASVYGMDTKLFEQRTAMAWTRGNPTSQPSIEVKSTPSRPLLLLTALLAAVAAAGVVFYKISRNRQA